ncbi:MAG: D-alanyl-D-alanine carboxypeptidase/D-alanyl-D-alanine-endopeptidase [Bacteroidetes bacterium]|nr:D-alanyl-D-alanine carboxypeptidase/D-alanyl-D-alanine-endopeptidase [Bacteroidota bacterium]MCL5737666.1 D-alanyl-D-alanine carboxypeptidase/D-alanyl-D-alanine-endopeptidase [Bacteroidota bacterium]
MRCEKFILLPVFISILISLPAVSQARQTKSEHLLKREITFIVKRAGYPRTIKAIEIYSRRHKKTIYQSYSGLLLHPASNLKIVTTSCALQSLGDNYNFKTKFEISGVQKADTLFGNLIAVGGGDPILSDADLDSSAKMISESGIKYVEGNLVVDISKFDSLQWGNGWMWDDEPASFAMFISPACLDHNSITVNISVDSTSGRLVANTQPKTNFVKIVYSAVPDSTDSLYVTRTFANDTNTIFVSGTYSHHLSPFNYDFSVRHPAHYFGSVLRESLEKYGVKIAGNLAVKRYYMGTDTIGSAIPRTKNIFTFEHSIDTVITYTNKVSDNLGAECFLREVPAEIAGEIGSAENGIKIEKGFLEQCGVDSTEYYIVDGSGVSHYDLITPEAIVKVLNHMLDQPTKQIFIHSLPIAGVDGSLQDRMTEKFVAGKVFAKTGSISGVSTLSGYVFIPRDTLVFSMMMQNFIASEDSMRALQDNLCTVLSQYNDNVRVFARNLRKYKIGTYGLVRHRYVRHKSRGSAIKTEKNVTPLKKLPQNPAVDKH